MPKAFLSQVLAMAICVHVELMFLSNRVLRIELYVHLILLPRYKAVSRHSVL